METVFNRLFIAIPAPVIMKEVLVSLREVNAALKNVRWIREQNLHVTVYFLGNVEIVHIPLIQAAMEQCLQAAPPFTLQLDAITFEGGKLGKPSMVWARFHRNKQFTLLAGAIGKRVGPYVAAPSKFSDPVPHVTLARIKPGPVPDISVKVVCEIEFKGYELWRSISIPTGVRYEKI
ncbi:MAG: RNA 2',3'-cyclic phosphodiesterase [Bacteroidota bacterium]|nr:RNA 2',3'-cyclic phosphodiesterase [Bacteroidota bacterium]